MRVRDLSFVREIDTGKRKTPIVIAYLFAVLVAVLAVQIIVGAGIRVATGTEKDVSSFFSQLIEGVTDLVPILIIFAWVAWFERRRVSSLGLRGGRGWLVMLLGVVVGGALIALAAAPAIIAGDVVVSDADASSNPGGLAVLGIVLATIPIWIIQGGSEEIIFRGFLLQRSLYSWPTWLAIAVTSVVFAAVHPGAWGIGKLNVALFGVLAAVIVIWQNSIWLVIGIHAGWNFVQGNVLGIAVSGEGRENSLIHFEPVPGRDLLSGGSFGTEGSIYATVVLLLAIIVAWLLARRRLATGDAGSESPAVTSTTAS
ncbi:CPBP family intramembrane glutamic endopeptidase [Microbacterium sp. C23T]